LFNSASYNPGLEDTTARLNSLSGMLSSGNATETIKNDAADRESWKKLLDEFDKFYQDHPPFGIFYNPLPFQKGNTDYDSRKAVLEFELLFGQDVTFDSMQKVFRLLAEGLKKTQRQELWGLAERPYRSPLFQSKRTYKVAAELLNNRNEVVGKTQFTISSRIFLLRRTLLPDTSSLMRQSFPAIHIDKELTPDMHVRIVNIDGIETEKVMQDGFIRIIPMEKLPRAKGANLLAIITRSL
jgi:hypothetical protein